MSTGCSHKEAIIALARRLEWSYLMHHTDRPAGEALLALHTHLSGQSQSYRARTAPARARPAEARRSARMSFGMIGFLATLLLSGLISLPVIWWLLRFTPPRPQEVAFPPIRLLLGLRSEEETPSRSPWWLTALRMLIAALIIIALAGPVFNPQREPLAANRPLLIVVDNSWAAASRWQLARI